MKRFPIFTTLVAVFFLHACASLGLAPAQSFDQKLAYAYGTHTAVLQTAGAAVQAGTLSKTDGQTVLNLADESRTLLDSARSLSTTDTTAAGNKLALAVAVLTQLQTYLNSKGVK